MKESSFLRTHEELDALTRKHSLVASFIVEHAELTYKQIAAELGVSRHTVIRRAKQAGIRRLRGPKLFPK